MLNTKYFIIITTCSSSKLVEEKECIYIVFF